MAGLNGFRDPVSRSQEYLRYYSLLNLSCLTVLPSFRGSVPLKRISTSGEQSWAVFDTGPAGQGGRPLVCLYCSPSLTAGLYSAGVSAPLCRHCGCLLQAVPRAERAGGPGGGRAVAALLVYTGGHLVYMSNR